MATLPKRKPATQTLIALVMVEHWDVQTLLATALEQQRRTLAKETTRSFTCGLVVWPRGISTVCLVNHG